MTAILRIAWEKWRRKGISPQVEKMKGKRGGALEFRV
jgi:hypothetical protein